MAAPAPCRLGEGILPNEFCPRGAEAGRFRGSRRVGGATEHSANDGCHGRNATLQSFINVCYRISA